MLCLMKSRMANLFIETPSHPKISLRTHCALSALVFVALLCVRLYWLFFALANPSFLFEHIPMLNNNDGYYYAEGARDILAGFHQEGDLSPVSAPLSILTAAIAFVLPVSLDWLLLVMPAFLVRSSRSRSIFLYPLCTRCCLSAFWCNACCLFWRNCCKLL